MKVDEFRKTWIRNFPESELKEYQHAVDVQGDPMLRIWSEAYSINDNLMEGFYSVHYSGRGDLDDFWNTLLKLRPIAKKKVVAKKKRVARKKTASKKATPKKKVTKKKVAAKKRVTKKKVGTLVEF